MDLSIHVDVWQIILMIILGLIGLITTAWYVGMGQQKVVGSVEALNTTLQDMKKWLNKVDDKVDNHAERIAALEGSKP